MRGSVRAAPLLDGSSANALRRPGSNNRAGSSLRSQLRSCSADRPSHAVGPFDRSQHFLGDDLRLGRRLVLWVITAAVRWRCGAASGSRTSATRSGLLSGFFLVLCPD